MSPDRIVRLCNTHAQLSKGPVVLRSRKLTSSVLESYSGCFEIGAARFKRAIQSLALLFTMMTQSSISTSRYNTRTLIGP